MSFFDTAPTDVLAIIYEFKASMDQYQQAQDYMTWRTYAAVQEIVHLSVQELDGWAREDLIWDAHTELEQDMHMQIDHFPVQVQNEILNEMWNLLATEAQLQLANLPDGVEED